MLQSVAVCVGAKMLSKHDVSLQLSWMCVAAIQGVCFAVCFSVFQCVVVCCSVLHSIAVYTCVFGMIRDSWLRNVLAVCCGVLQCFAVCCSALQHVAVCCSVLPAVCCSAKCFMSYGVATMSRMLKIQVSFAKETYKRDLYSAKRPVFLSILLIVATPYVK